MKRAVSLFLTIVSVSLLSACGQGGNAPKREGPGQPAGVQSPAAEVAPIGKPVIHVPDMVRGKWKGVVILVEDKDRKSVKEYFISLGEKYRVPDSDLTVLVKEFFPSFLMKDSDITSKSNTPDNPAAQVVVMEGGSEIFSGWLFGRYPATHAFSHPKYAITLKEGVPRN